MASCRNHDKRGTTILDGLRLCFSAEPSLFGHLSEIIIDKSTDIGRYTFHRIKGQHNSHVFIVTHLHDGVCKEFGKLKFGFSNDERFENLVWLWVDNRVLYNEPELRLLYDLVETLKLTFNNFTMLDIAKDFKKNIVTMIRKLYKDEGNTTIINGKAVKDRKKVIPELRFDYSVSLDKLIYPSFCAKQREALDDKTKGTAVTVYNKLAEIKNKSHKNYISEYYNNPTSLHRLETHINRDEINQFGLHIGIKPSIDWIFDKEILEDMFFYHLHSVIRFTRKRDRKKLDWREILM